MLEIWPKWFLKVCLHCPSSNQFPASNWCLDWVTKIPFFHPLILFNSLLSFSCYILLIKYLHVKNHFHSFFTGCTNITAYFFRDLWNLAHGSLLPLVITSSSLTPLRRQCSENGGQLRSSETKLGGSRPATVSSTVDQLSSSGAEKSRTVDRSAHSSSWQQRGGSAEQQLSEQNAQISTSYPKPHQRARRHGGKYKTLLDREKMDKFSRQGVKG